MRGGKINQISFLTFYLILQVSRQKIVIWYVGTPSDSGTVIAIFFKIIYIVVQQRLSNRTRQSPKKIAIEEESCGTKQEKRSKHQYLVSLTNKSQNFFIGQPKVALATFDAVLVSFMLAMNRFHPLFLCFHYWIWTSKYWRLYFHLN